MTQPRERSAAVVRHHHVIVGIACLLLLSAALYWRFISSDTLLSASIYDDEFEDASTLANWTIAYQGATTIDINNTTPGKLTMIPSTRAIWLNDESAPFVYKLVSGDIVVAAHVRAQNSANPNQGPTKQHNTAGLLVRNPLSAPMSNPRNQNWLSVDIGSQSTSTGFSQKNTTNSASVVSFSPGSFSGELRICRIGNVFRTYRMADGETVWRETGVYTRNDLPHELQIGLVVNTSYQTPPDIRAEFEYVRFGIPTSIADCTATLPWTPPEGNSLPTVQITNPADGTTVSEGSSIDLSVNASDSDGAVTRVEFYADDLRVGEDVSAPYAFLWTNIPVGSHVLTAVAMDNTGAFTTSTPITVTVTAAGAVSTVPVPLIDMSSTANYYGFSGGLYPDVSNVPPANHDAVGRARGGAIQKLDRNGVPHQNGAMVFLSIGLLTTDMEMYQFQRTALGRLSGNKDVAVLRHATSGGQDIGAFDDPADLNYNRIRDSVLGPRYSEAQVQAVWLKTSTLNPLASFASSTSMADAHAVQAGLGRIVRTLKVRYPNLQQVFISSLPYHGYSTIQTWREPYSYETGFAVKWLIESQINQMNTGVIDARSGNLNYTDGTAPWLAWGPYLWANGTQPNSEGLSWSATDFAADGVGSVLSGTTKVVEKLWTFFMNSPYTSWFSNGTVLALTDMGSQTYLGFSGGLYPNGSNNPPALHTEEGIARGSGTSGSSERILPLDIAGNPNDETGRIVLLSIGMSNTIQDFAKFQDLLCADFPYPGDETNPSGHENTPLAAPFACNPTDTRVSPKVALVNGALGGEDADNWDGSSPTTEGNLERIRFILLGAGLSEAQVQAIWLKQAIAGPTSTLFDGPLADAYNYQQRLGNTIRILNARYPNLRQVFISNRSYGGYNPIFLNPEPFAYENGFAVKWLIESQINQMTNGGILGTDTNSIRSGNLNYTDGTAPWLAWGPNLWANGTTPNADGLAWYDANVVGGVNLGDFRADDHIHPSLLGREKVANRLINFFLTSVYTPWFRP